MVMEYATGNWPVLAGGVLLGLAVGTLTGLFGAGGGFIVTPALNIFLGLDMNLAVGTSACQVLGASTFALAHQLDRRMLGLRVALWVGLGIPFGSLPGVWLVRKFTRLPPWEVAGRTLNPVDLVLLGVFAVFLLAIAAWMLYDGFRTHNPAQKPRGVLAGCRLPPAGRFRTIPSGEFSIPVLVALGVAVGFLGGLLGIGGGVVMMPALYYLVGQEFKAAVLTSTMLVFTSGFCSTVFHAVGGNIDYALAAALVAGALGGARFGSGLQRRLHARVLCKYFALVVLAAWLMVVWKLARLLA